MAIKRDLSDLPPAGLAPDEQPRFISVLVDEWAGSRDDDKPTAMGTPFRHSDAGKCARAISYTAPGIPRSDPMDITGVWHTSLGSLTHEPCHEALPPRWPDAALALTRSRAAPISVGPCPPFSTTPSIAARMSCRWFERERGGTYAVVPPNANTPTRSCCRFRTYRTAAHS